MSDETERTLAYAMPIGGGYVHICPTCYRNQPCYDDCGIRCTPEDLGIVEARWYIGNSTICECCGVAIGEGKEP